MSTTVHGDVRPVTETLTQLLAGLGFADERLNSAPKLAIDQFDQWTNPEGGMLIPSSGVWHGTGIELERVS